VRSRWCTMFLSGLWLFITLSVAQVEQNAVPCKFPLSGNGGCTLPLASFANSLELQGEIGGKVLLVAQASVDRQDIYVGYTLGEGYSMEQSLLAGVVEVNYKITSASSRTAMSLLLSVVCIGFITAFGPTSAKTMLPLALLLLAVPLVQMDTTYDATITVIVPSSALGFEVTSVNIDLANPGNLETTPCETANCNLLKVSCPSGLVLDVTVLPAECKPPACSEGEYGSGGFCIACTTCPPGSYQDGTICTGLGTDDTQSCAECSNGGSNYICPLNYYKDGSDCAGGSATIDTQSCTACRMECPSGQYLSQTNCSGEETSDHQCIDCIIQANCLDNPVNKSAECIPLLSGSPNIPVFLYCHECENSNGDLNSGSCQGECFPATAILSGSEKPMSTVAVGDMVITPYGEEKVTNWMHRQAQHESDFLRIKTDKGALELSPRHLLYLHGKFQFAKRVQPGDKLSYKDGTEATVLSIEKFKSVGVYAPSTPSGELYVDGFRVSCYAETENHITTHYLVGVPMQYWPSEVIDGHHPWVQFWLDLVEFLGIPQAWEYDTDE